MRKLIWLVCLGLFTFGLIINHAEAKRFGGGKSFGIQRTTNHYSRAMPNSVTNSASTASKWLAPLAGLAAGGMLAYLLMGHGIGTGILSWLVIGALIYLLFNFLRNRLQPAHQSVLRNQFTNNSMYEATPSFTQNTSSLNSQHLHDIPNFDSESFLRDAKTKFIRLQAAYDASNLNDLREFTTPEVFAEIQLQIQERGESVNQTEVVKLNAELLDAANEFNVMVASVRFSGSIREDLNQIATTFSEIWHFRKDNNTSSWHVAGVQQTN